MNQKLLEALRRGNERDALQALELHPNSLFAWLDGEPLLHSAVRQGMLELARTLLEAGAEVDQRNCYGNTPRHSVVHLEDARHLLALPLLELLEAFGAAPSLLNNARRTPLCELFWWGAWAGDRQSLTRALLDSGEQPNVADATGNTALHYLCEIEGVGDPELVTILLAGGADLTLSNSAGETPQQVFARVTSEGSHIHMPRQTYEAIVQLLYPD